MPLKAGWVIDEWKQYEQFNDVPHGGWIKFYINLNTIRKTNKFVYWYEIHINEKPNPHIKN